MFNPFTCSRDFRRRRFRVGLQIHIEREVAADRAPCIVPQILAKAEQRPLKKIASAIAARAEQQRI